MELFRDHFEGDGDITSHDTLLRAAGRAGLDGKEAKEWLEGGHGGQQVDAEFREARERNVSGVPSFVIQGKHVVEGAQEEQAFLEVFAAVKDAEAVV